MSHKLPNKRLAGDTSKPSTTSKAQIRVPDLVTSHLEARASSSLTWKKALWRPSKIRPSGDNTPEESWTLSERLRSEGRGTCWIISWMWLLILRQRKIQDLCPTETSLLYSCHKVSCAVWYPTCPGGKGKEKQITLKHSSTKSIWCECGRFPLKERRVQIQGLAPGLGFLLCSGLTQGLSCTERWGVLHPTPPGKQPSPPKSHRPPKKLKNDSARGTQK